MENGEYKLSNEKRITTLEQNFISLREDIKEIKENHLAHLESKMDRIQWILVTTLITVVVSLAMRI